MYTFEANVLGIPSDGLKQKWVHVAAVFYNGVPDPINNELYINGVKQNLSYVLGQTTAARNVYSSAYISGFADEWYNFKGKIANVRIWNRTLSAEEVRSYMYQLAIKNARDLVGVWNLNDDPSGDIVYIYDASGRIKSIKLPSGQKYQYRYDANGNLIDIVGR